MKILWFVCFRVRNGLIKEWTTSYLSFNYEDLAKELAALYERDGFETLVFSSTVEPVTK